MRFRTLKPFCKLQKHLFHDYPRGTSARTCIGELSKGGNVGVTFKAYSELLLPDLTNLFLRARNGIGCRCLSYWNLWFVLDWWDAVVEEMRNEGNRFHD